jgi:alpha-glucoside transport system permease protein
MTAAVVAEFPTPEVVDADKPREPVGRSISATLSSRTGRILVWLLAILWTVPTFGLFLTSFRPERAIKTTGWWTFFKSPKLTTQNYSDVLSSRSGVGLSTYFINSMKITLPATIIPILIACLAAYALCWMNFKGRDWIFIGIVSLLVVPLQMALIPLLQLFVSGAHIGTVTIFPGLHLTNSVVTVWIAHTCFALPFCIFILKNFVGALPQELIEAARVDGAGHLTIFRKVILPLTLPALASLAIFQFLWVWNDFLVGKIFGGTRNAPLTAKLVEVSGSRGQDWQLLTSAAFISMVVPLIVFFSLQRYFVRGLLSGAVKG